MSRKWVPGAVLLACSALIAVLVDLLVRDGDWAIGVGVAAALAGLGYFVIGLGLDEEAK